MQAASKHSLPFEEARELVRKVELKSQNEWWKWCRDGHRPPDIPAAPDRTYRARGWKSWPDWLG